ncbi:MAG: hypothetical protein ACJ719_04425 [Nitrososphaeraceae archaeon]
MDTQTTLSARYKWRRDRPRTRVILSNASYRFMGKAQADMQFILLCSLAYF